MSSLALGGGNLSASVNSPTERRRGIGEKKMFVRFVGLPILGSSVDSDGIMV